MKFRYVVISLARIFQSNIAIIIDHRKWIKNTDWLYENSIICTHETSPCKVRKRFVPSLKRGRLQFISLIPILTNPLFRPLAVPLYFSLDRCFNHISWYGQLWQGFFLQFGNAWPRNFTLDAGREDLTMS